MWWFFWFVFFNSLFLWSVSHEPARVHWRQPSAKGNRLHGMGITASIQWSGSFPGQWDQLFFWEAVHVGLLILQMNYRKKERRKHLWWIVIGEGIYFVWESFTVCLWGEDVLLLLLVLTLEAETEGSLLLSCVKLLLSSPTQICEVCEEWSMERAWFFVI